MQKDGGDYEAPCDAPDRDGKVVEVGLRSAGYA